MNSHISTRIGIICLLVIIALGPAGRVSSSESLATNRYVSTIAAASDLNNDCSNSLNPCATVQWAINQAAAGDSIYLRGTRDSGYTFMENLILIKENLTILGDRPAGAKVTIDGSAGGLYGRVMSFNADVHHFTMQQVIIQNGNSSSSGGGIYFPGNGLPGNRVILNDVIVQNNHVTQTNDGGGIYVLSGSLYLSRVIIRNNSTDDNSDAYGGGISFHSVSAGDILSIDDSAITGNTAKNGAGLDILGTAWIQNSAITGNATLANGSGGGIYAAGANAYVSLVNVTVSGNSSRYHGGGITVGDNSQVTLNHVTLANNTANQGQAEALGVSPSGSLHMKNTLLSASTPNSMLCNYSTNPSALVSEGHNLSDNNVLCNLTVAGQDIIAASLNLGPLASNGGFTQTMALLLGSPAIDHAVDTGVATDQRGLARADGDFDGMVGVDIGAYEYVPFHVFIPSVQK